MTTLPLPCEWSSSDDIRTAVFSDNDLVTETLLLSSVLYLRHTKKRR